VKNSIHDGGETCRLFAAGALKEADRILSLRSVALLSFSIDTTLEPWFVVAALDLQLLLGV
jgi:hypothetical protein